MLSIPGLCIPKILTESVNLILLLCRYLHFSLMTSFCRWCVKNGDSKRVLLCVTHVDRSKGDVRLRTKRAQFLTAFGRSGFSYGKRESVVIGQRRLLRFQTSHWEADQRGHDAGGYQTGYGANSEITITRWAVCLHSSLEKGSPCCTQKCFISIQRVTKSMKGFIRQDAST